MDTTKKLLKKLGTQEIHFKSNEFVDFCFECDPKKLSPETLSAKLTNAMALTRFNDIYAYMEENNQTSRHSSFLNLINPLMLLNSFFNRPTAQSVRQVPTSDLFSRETTNNKDELNKQSIPSKENTLRAY